jgi:type 1 fimbriae regulatory protein FimB/type 1 fimbriae regulatory protein FimE
MLATVVPLHSSKCLKSFGGHKKNQELRSREHLTPDEVERMIAAARQRGRYGNRDALLIMLAYRHGLRASELIALRWDQIDFNANMLHVNRLKHGTPSTHPIRGPEIRLLHAWQREQGVGTYIFTSERGGPMTRINVHHLVTAIAKAAGIEFPVHAHMLRHATGFYLANATDER